MKLSSEPVAALEIGTSNTVIAIGESIGGGRVKVAAINSIPSSGVRKSQIIDIGQARYSIESVLRHLADQSDYSIGQACLAVSGPQIKTKHVPAQIPVTGGIVHEEDLNAVDARSYEESGLTPDRYPIELSQISYSLDDIDDIASPKDMRGNILKLHSLCIHGAAQCISNARESAHQARLEIPEEDIFFAGSCAAAAVLTPQNKKDGALVIDLGGGSTAYTVWCEGKLLHAGVLGVGGDHVTNDIRVAFGISQPQAETLKTTQASAMIAESDAANRVNVPDPTPGFKAATVSRRALNTVVNARLQELFSIIRQKMDEENLLHRLNAGIVLTGGGSALARVAELAANVFGCGARVGSLIPEIEGLEKEPHPASRAVIAGLLLLAQQQEAPASGLFDSFKNLFRFSK